MKKFMLGLLTFVTICTVSCKKESINPAKKTIEKEYMRSGGGDKRPNGNID